ncbi:unnamed protein product [Allacma fusca]|uniref:Major facilitator superfamily (MFS) profile domain-containing protein n=1 Tax=Allacma fusca TaxID=39272 RepID=A0A8J2PK78_9HEXA|nr:unnamed protein product [Allacma fusca]
MSNEDIEGKSAATNEDKKVFTRKKLRQFFSAGAASIGGFSLGASLGWSSPALISMRERKDFGDVSANMETWIASIVAIGACLASPLAGFCMQRLGRKSSLVLFSAPYVLGWLLITFANSIAMIMVGRFVTGLCGGVITMTSPIYITEISSDAVRGTLGSAFMIMIIFGTICTYGVGAIVSWKWMSLFNAFFPAILLVCLLFIPESPIFAIMKGRIDEARETLKWLRKAESDEEIEPELTKMMLQVEASQKYSKKLRDLFGPDVWKPTAISMSLVFFSQLSGVQAVLFYAKDIVESTNSGVNPDVAAVLLGCAVIVASALMDKAGRRILLVGSEIGMAVAFTAIGVFFYLREQNDGENPANLSWLPVAGLIVFIMSFAAGMGPLPRVVLSEIIPLHVKGPAAAVAFMFNWIWAFAVTKTFNDLIDALNESGFFWFYAAISLVGAVVIYFTVPETRGKSVEEIQLYFNKKSNIA